MSAKSRRAVIVVRPTELQALVERHGTRSQAAFFLETRGGSLEDVLERHRRFEAAFSSVRSAIPADWRCNVVTRSELSRFLFEPEDIVVTVGRDGLVANVAKYLSEQPVIGVNPDPSENAGQLVHFAPERFDEALAATAQGRVTVESRTMVETRLDDGQVLVALNEIYIGTRTHQSARYRFEWRGHELRQISSGLIVSSGTGATGWAASIHRERAEAPALPGPQDDRLAFFVREAFPGAASDVGVTCGSLTPDRALAITSEMDEDGVIFGDGVEEDALPFSWGSVAKISVAERRLRLVA